MQLLIFIVVVGGMLRISYLFCNQLNLNRFMKVLVSFIVVTISVLCFVRLNAQTVILGWDQTNVPILEYSSTDLYIDGGVTVHVTVYQPTKAQTDNTPCIAASGYNVCNNPLGDVVAVSQDFIKSYGINYYDKIKLVSVTGLSRIYTVVDCMNKKFTHRIDILGTSKKIYGVCRMIHIKNKA